MAFIRTTHPTYLLVQYRTADGTQKSWRCATRENFEAFNTLETAHKRAGTEIPDPVGLFGEVPRPPGAKAAKKQAAAAQGSEQERRRQARRAAEPMPSAAVWVGNPSRGQEGEYFRHAGTMKPGQKDRYKSLLRKYGSHFKDKPMDAVIYDDAYQMMLNMIACKACTARAAEAGRADLLANPGASFRADQRPWDDPEGTDPSASRCVDEDGESTHWGRNGRATVIGGISLMRSLWRVATSAGQLGHVPAFKTLTNQPFEKVTTRIPMYPERPTNDDLAEALSHGQLERLRLGFPDWLKAAPRTGAYGLQRRSELMGMERSMIVWPSLPEHHGQSTVTLTHTYVLTNGQAVRQPWGKTPGSTREAIHLTRLATDELREHMRTWRSNPNPAKCAACRDGIGEHLDAKTNPHRGCDFANDAPVWWDFAKNQRLHPTDYSNTYFATACELSGLTPKAIGFKPTPKLLRATGATLLIDAGVPIAQVAKMGRWQDENVLRRHYHRMRDASKTEAALALDNATRGELGLEGVDGASLEERVRFQQRRIEVLEEMLAWRDQLLNDLGVDEETVNAVKRPELADLWPRRVHRLSDIDRIRELAATATNRVDMLRQLGLTAGNAKRLEALAAEHDITLPPPYASNPDIVPPSEVIARLTADALREAATGAASITHVMNTIGIPVAPYYRHKLERKATELGVALPAVRQRGEPVDVSVLDDGDLLRTLAATQPSLTAILNALDLPRTTSTYDKLHQAAARHGITLPGARKGTRKRAA